MSSTYFEATNRVQYHRDWREEERMERAHRFLVILGKRYLKIKDNGQVVWVRSYKDATRYMELEAESIAAMHGAEVCRL